MSFQIFLLVGHLTNWTGHNLLTDNTLKKRTQDVLVTCSVIVSDHNVKLAGHFQNLVGQCPMTDCYFQHWVCDLVHPREMRHVYLRTGSFTTCVLVHTSARTTCVLAHFFGVLCRNIMLRSLSRAFVRNASTDSTI